MFVTCIKTGRFWPCRDYADGERKARLHGLKDYTIGVEND